MNQAGRRDEIDAIVDDILARPDRAEELKRVLRERLGKPASRTEGTRRFRVVPNTPASDPDSLWDNMPV